MSFLIECMSLIPGARIVVKTHPLDSAKNDDALGDIIRDRGTVVSDIYPHALIEAADCLSVRNSTLGSLPPKGSTSCRILTTTGATRTWSRCCIKEFLVVTTVPTILVRRAIDHLELCAPHRRSLLRGIMKRLF